MSNHSLCNYPYGVWDVTIDDCRCRFGLLGLYTGNSPTCQFEGVAGLLVVRAFLMLFTSLSLCLWLLKLFLLFRNVSRDLFDLPKVIGYLWATGFLSALILLSCCEAHLTGDALVWVAYICFSIFELSSFAMLIYSRWFFLLCLSLLLNVTDRMVKIFNYVHVGVFGLLWCMFVSTGIASTVRSITVSSPGQNAGLYTFLLVCLILVLLYTALVLAVPSVLIWVQFTSRPAAVIRATQRLWIIHFGLAVYTLALTLFIIVSLIVSSLNNHVVENYQTTVSTIAGFFLVFLVTVTSYFTISHQPDYNDPLENADSEVVSSISSPLLAAPVQIPRHLNIGVLQSSRLPASLYPARHSGWDNSGDFEEPKNYDTVPLLSFKSDGNSP